jgi:hypothetical protein
MHQDPANIPDHFAETSYGYKAAKCHWFISESENQVDDCSDCEEGAKECICCQVGVISVHCCFHRALERY